jgi:hypothetical protein
MRQTLHVHEIVPIRRPEEEVQRMSQVRDSLDDKHRRQQHLLAYRLVVMEVGQLQRLDFALMHVYLC